MEKKHSLKNLFGNRRNARSETPVAVPTVTPPQPQPKPAAIEPEILAVITALLEIELKLYFSPAESRMTFHNGKNNSGWDTLGKQLLSPYRGG
jgi:hypothetical protein